jgi:PhoPQ-activated pathogenicity-related protein
VQTLAAFYDSVVRGSARPRYEWKFERDGSIAVETSDRPTEVRLWQATNPTARDFRLDTLGPAWKGEVLEADTGGRYRANVAAPAAGWTAFFVELTYPTGGLYPLKFTSGVRVVPDSLPFPAPARNRP